MTYKIYKDDYYTNYEYMKVEEAGIQDAEDVLKLQKVAYVSEAEIINDFKIQPLTQTIDETIDEFKNQLILKASVTEDNMDRPGSSKKQEYKKIISSVRGYQKDATCHIGKLIVDPRYQGLGIGKEMMNIVEKHFKETSRFEVFTGERSLRNIRLYERMGYRAFRTKKISERLNLVFMEKVLSGRGDQRT